ncbi:MAG: TlpA family protein disulfide reductase [Actinomycetota bacterium]|nr:TlpA family protein disulfide reductase [Actinomycetota bacterium]
MKPVLRWVMVAALLVFALGVALWPRPDATSAVSTGAAQPAGAPADLDALRSRADLRPCPKATSSAIPVRGVLSGVELPCLGQPGTVDLGAALAGRPALLNLWGPLCQPCLQELPALAAYAAEPDAVPVLGVEVQRLPEGALEMLTALDVHYPSVSDPAGRLRAALGAPPVLPLSFVVSADGRVSQVTPPEVLRTPEQVRAVVQRYLDPGSQGPGSHGTVG